MLARVRTTLKKQHGMTTVEYAIAGGLISGAVIVAFTLLGGNAQRIFDYLAEAIGNSPILS